MFAFNASGCSARRSALWLVLGAPGTRQAAPSSWPITGPDPTAPLFKIVPAVSAPSAGRSFRHSASKLRASAAHMGSSSRCAAQYRKLPRTTAAAPNNSAIEAGRQPCPGCCFFCRFWPLSTTAAASERSAKSRHLSGRTHAASRSSGATAGQVASAPHTGAANVVGQQLNWLGFLAPLMAVLMAVVMAVLVGTDGNHPQTFFTCRAGED